MPLGSGRPGGRPVAAAGRRRRAGRARLGERPSPGRLVAGRRRRPSASGRSATLALLPVPLAVPLAALVGVAGLLLAAGRPTGGDRGAAPRRGRGAAQRPAHRTRGADRGRRRRLVPAAGRERDVPPARRRRHPAGGRARRVGVRRRGGPRRGTARLPGAAHRRPARAGAAPARGRGDRMDRGAGRRPRVDPGGRRPGHRDRHAPDRGRRAGRRQLAGATRTAERSAGSAGCCWRRPPGSGSPTSASRRRRPTPCRRPWRCSWSAWTGCGATREAATRRAHARTPARDRAVTALVPRRPGDLARRRGWASPASAWCSPARWPAGTHRWWWAAPSAACWWSASWRRTPPRPRSGS